LVDDVDANLAGRGSGVAITDVVGGGHEKLCVVAAEHGPRDRSGKVTESCEAQKEVCAPGINIAEGAVTYAT
jgi:hypothetical protein